VQAKNGRFTARLKADSRFVARKHSVDETCQGLTHQNKVEQNKKETKNDAHECSGLWITICQLGRSSAR